MLPTDVSRNPVQSTEEDEEDAKTMVICKTCNIPWERNTSSLPVNQIFMDYMF
jgi:hypothetical protein